MSRRIIVLATVLAMALAVTLASPARAGDAARHCQTYYHHNDPSTGWGFTVCVKLIHDPTRHAWSTAASVSSSTPGVILGFVSVRVNISGALYDAGIGPDGVGFIHNNPRWWRCSGSQALWGDAWAWVRWPNGVVSSQVRTLTRDPTPEYPGDAIITGNC